jgi:cyclophilin family peptidyl-prolyl cis-trans isomerase
MPINVRSAESTARGHAMRVAALILAAVIAPAAPAVRPVAAQATAPPAAVFETVKGVFEIEFFPAEAPKSVAHLVGLVEKRFYRGQRVHRVTSGLVQFGDPQTRSMTLRDYWGRSGSGRFIGVAEFSKRSHTRGIVSLAHPGRAEQADSQLFIVKVATPAYDGKHTIVGRVTRGMDVVDRLAVTDLFKQVTLRAAARTSPRHP